MASCCCAAVPIGFRRDAMSGRQPVKDSQRGSGIFGMFLAEPLGLVEAFDRLPPHGMCFIEEEKILLSLLRDTVA